jgi:long-subunit fatty acid transport protein
MKKSLLVLLLVLAVPASAQVESALLSKITFNLTNPGGKSLAMGGAFTAIADDATAAIANPAGLGLLSSVEVGISGKRSDDVIGLVTARSTASGSYGTSYPPVYGVNSDISAQASSVEFAGVVLPVSRRFVAAVSFAENLRFEGDPGEDGYTYIELRDNRSGGSTRRDYLFEFREYGAVSLRNRLLGLSAAYRATDRLRIGAGVTLNRMELDLLGDAGGAHRIFHRNYEPTKIKTSTTTMAIRGLDQNTLGFVVGVHADLLPDGRLTAGAVYRQTGKATGTLEIGGDVPEPLWGQETRSFSARVPRDAAVGLAARPFPGLTVAAEAQWIAYGDFIDRSLPTGSYEGRVGPFPGFPLEDPILAELSPPDDVILPRIGIEYIASTSDLLLAFRLGYHREPARGVTANLSAYDPSGAYDMTDPPYSESVRTVYDGGKPDDRFSGGLGATVSRRVSFDLAFDVGRFSRVLSASLFYRF